MPKISARGKLIKELNDALMVLVFHGKENSTEFKDILDVLAQVESTRYIDEKLYGSIPKSTWLLQNLLDLPEREFNNLIRMSKLSFSTVHELIKDHEIFQNEANNKQADVWFQLAVVLARIGSDGTGSCIQRTAFLTGVGYGTVDIYTKRVFKAILSIKKDFIFWFDYLNMIYFNVYNL